MLFLLRSSPSNFSTARIFSSNHYPLVFAGNLCMITGGRNLGRVGTIIHRERHPGSFDIVHVKDTAGHKFATRCVPPVSFPSSSLVLLTAGLAPVNARPKTRNHGPCGCAFKILAIGRILQTVAGLVTCSRAALPKECTFHIFFLLDGA